MTNQGQKRQAGISASPEGGGSDLSEYLQRIEEALNVARCSMEKRRNRGVVGVRGLAKRYLENRARIVCEFELSEGAADHFSAFACFERYRHGAKPDPANTHISLYPGEAGCCDQEPVLVGVTELIEYPEVVPCTSTVCLHMIDEIALNGRRCVTQEARTLHLTGELISVVGVWEPNILHIASQWAGKSHGSVIERASKVPNGISDHRVNRLVDLMKRIEAYKQPPGFLIRLKSDSVEVCRQIEGDPGIYLRNVVACAI